MGNFNFLAKICPNMDLGLETEKTSVGIGITILEILCVAIFSQMGNFYFFAQICPKMDLGSEIQKTNVIIRIRISIHEIPYVPIFRQNEKPWLFWPEFAQKWI